MKCLIADDEPFILKDIHRTAGAVLGEDTEFFLAENSDEALKIIETEKGVQDFVHIAFLDIEMPYISGLEVAKKIQEISPRTNIIFVTGHEKFAYESFRLHPSGFVLKSVTEEAVKNELANLRFPTRHVHKEALLKVQCFGEFEVFDKEGNPVRFSRNKSKELFAYMIDRKGELCTTSDFCEVLFENGEDERKLKNQIRVFLKSLRDDLEKVGALEVLVKGWNANGVDCKKLDCDYFDLLREEVYAVNSFQGEYMSQYPWAEMTLGELNMKSDMY